MMVKITDALTGNNLMNYCSICVETNGFDPTGPTSQSKGQFVFTGFSIEKAF
jgi:hypothetical protein